jgi:hypothetical protein
MLYFGTGRGEVLSQINVTTNQKDKKYPAPDQ